MKEIREPSTDEEYDQGSVVRQFEPEVLNTVDNSTADFERVQLGMRQVVATGGQGGGTAYSYFNGSNQVSYEAAAKTGTAEVTAQNGVRGNNQTMIAYAPYDDPEVAIAVVVPNVALDSSGGRQGIANHIARESLSAYFDLKEDRVNPQREEDEAEIYADPEEGVEDDIE